jgi:signal transduction histidine kinase
MKHSKAKTPDLSNKILIKMVKIALLGFLGSLLITIIFQAKTRQLVTIIFSIVLLLAYFINYKYIKGNTLKLIFYIFEFLVLSLLTVVVGNSLMSTLYVIILSDFYMNFAFKANVYMSLSIFLFYAIAMLFAKEKTFIGVQDLYALFIKDMIVFLLDFVIINLSLTILRRNYEIEKNLALVHKREQKLKEAYDKLEEVTILEERNRIAKEIHDTTGHSITTIIMQTEAAKLIIDKNPAEAKNKIISANMQAVNALEELRQSVRILSGNDTNFDLQASLLKTIEETMSGTNIIIRSKIDDFSVPLKIAKFLYSTLKEGLNNGIRHGKSTAFYFELKNTVNEIIFLLSDNGNGVNLKIMEFGFGLTSMREKARQLGGKIYFVSEESEGFEIHITFSKKELNND